MLKRLSIIFFICAFVLIGNGILLANTVAFPMVDDFEDNNLTALPAWDPSGLTVQSTINVLASQGTYAMRITGSTAGWYVGYLSAYIGNTPDDWGAYNYLHLYIRNDGQIGDKIRIDIYDNDNVSWNVNMGTGSSGNDIWEYTLTLDWTGSWKEISIPLNSSVFTDSNPATGNDTFDLAPPGVGYPAVTQIGFAINAATAVGSIDIFLDSIHCSNSSANNTPYTPQLIAPYSDELFVTNNPTFRWSGSDPDGGRLTYNIYVSTNQIFQDLVVTTVNLTVNSSGTTIDNFEDNNTNLNPNWNATSMVRSITTNVAVGNGSYAMQLSGQASGYYVDYVNAGIAANNNDWVSANYLRLMVYNAGVTGDNFAIEIVDDDNNSWENTDTIGAGDDRWRYTVVMNWTNRWKEIFIPLNTSSLTLFNSGVGDGILNLGFQNGSTLGAAMLAFVVNSATATGNVNFLVDSIQLSSLAEAKLANSLEYGMTYYWKVEAIDSSAASASSTTGSFTTAKLESIPPNNIPYINLLKSNNQLVLQWSAPYDNNTLSSNLRYSVYRSEQTDFTNSENIISNVSTTSTTVTMSVGSTLNYYMVKAKDESQNVSVSSNLGVSQIFQVQASSNATIALPLTIPVVNPYYNASGLSGIVSTSNVACLQAINPQNSIIDPYFYASQLGDSWGGVNYNLMPTWNYQAIIKKGSNLVSINITGAQ